MGEAIVTFSSLKAACSSRDLKEQRLPIGRRFRLPMSRTDIASYLGLAVETVSRLFGRLQEQGMISADGKEIEILDQAGLNASASLSNRCTGTPREVLNLS